MSGTVSSAPAAKPMLHQMGRYEAPENADWGMPIVSGARVAEFRLGAMPVRIELPFFLVAVLLGVNGRPGWFLVWWVAVVFVSILVHELGHALVARAYGAQVSILLHGMGGLTFTNGGYRSDAQDIAVSVAGSLAGIVFLGLPARLIADSGAIHSFTGIVVVHDLAWVSLGWGIINLLPLLPLDGGNIAVTLLRRVNGVDAVRVARLISVGVALGLAIWAYHSVGMLTSLWALFFGVMNAVALTKNGN